MKPIYRVLLSVLSGLLLSLPWLGFPGWVLFVAFLPLFYLENYYAEHKEKYASVSFWGNAFLAVLVWNGVTTWWIAFATFTGALMAVVVNAFLMSLVLWLGHFARRQLKRSLGYIALTGFWISFEYLHFRWDIEWPWLTLGNGFANHVKLIQWYEFTGVLGGTLWVLWVNILLVKGIAKIKSTNRLKTISSGMIVSIVIFLPVIVSLRMYNHYQEKEQPRNIVIVQPNINPYAEDYSLDAENAKLRKFFQIAREAANEQTDFILGPETIVENYLNWNVDDYKESAQYFMFKNFKNEYPGAELMFGVSACKFYEGENEAPPTARQKNGKYFDVFNSAVFMRNNGELQFYHKSILVSGVEKIPFLKYFGFLKNAFIDLGGTSGNLGKQEESSVFETSSGTKVAPVICYESVFGGYLTTFVQKGAELIFIITNDGWWRNTPGYKQHLSFARLRAVETRRSIARAANTGISCFINQRGDVLQQTNWWQPASISGQLNANNRITFYVKYGDYLGRILLFVSVLILLFLVAGTLQKDKKNPH